MTSNLIDLDHINEKDARYDELFLSVLQSEGKIEPFLDNVFKFLYRRFVTNSSFFIFFLIKKKQIFLIFRTDFFLIQETPQQPYGFPNGIAKLIIQKVIYYTGLKFLI